MSDFFPDFPEVSLSHLSRLEWWSQLWLRAALFRLTFFFFLLESRTSALFYAGAFLFVFFLFFFGGEVESPEYFTPVCGVQVFMPRASRVHFFLWQSLVVFSCSVSARISNCLAPRVRHSYLACFSRLRVVAHS